MKRTACFALIAVLCIAQRSRDGYRAAYREWREADPNLEREAVGGGASIAQRADRLAAEAAKCASARKSFLESVAQDEGVQVSWLEKAGPGAVSAANQPQSDAQFVAAETAAVARMIDTFASDPDKGIQQLRQSLARERAALDSLNAAIAQRMKFADTVAASSNAIEEARAKAFEQSSAMLAGLTDTADEIGREAAAWAEYYRKVGEGAQGEAKPITQVPAGVPTATLNDPIAAPPTVTPLPTVRYVGSWTLPEANGLFHGPQPERFEVVVQEEGGHVKGTVSARFKLPTGSKDDPDLRFEFAGDFQPTRNQVFNLLTNDGAKGTVELIPGPAFNMLEINIQTDLKPGKVHQADVLLIKK